MGLPTKKQLHKHKRGTKKALDTLETLGSEEVVQSSDNRQTPKKSASKKTTRKKSGLKKVNKTQSKPVEKKNKSKKPKQKKVKEKKTPSTVVTDNVKKEEGTMAEPLPPQQESKNNKPTFSLDDTEINSTKQRSANLDVEIIEKSKSQIAKESVQIRDANSADIQGHDDDDDEDEDTQLDKYLTFLIGAEHFGIEIRYVTEIIVIQKITVVPDTAKCIRGIINLRGKVIPVMDVRERFGLDLKEYDERTCIIVVNHGDIAVGLIVDIVNEVVDIPSTDVDPPPKNHSGIETNYIAGLGKIGKEVKILLNIQNVLEISTPNLQSTE